MRFSRALSAHTPLPSLTPKVAGRWQVTGNVAEFEPVGAYPPETKLTLSVPGGQSGMLAADGGRLLHSPNRDLMTPNGDVAYAEQILARLHYLPLRTSASAPATRAAAALAVYSPPAGKFSWRWSDVPSSLAGLWSPKQPNTVLRGALITFQHDAGLTADGLLGPHTWRALLAADRAGRTDKHPYTYVAAVLDHLPQTLSVWEDGHIVISSPVNGGVAGAPTPVGSFPIYERLTTTTMSGTNPDGSHYSDPGVPWVNYFSGGSAVHGFPRASYGSPQSVGCLELPIPTAQRVFETVGYGTLVTVINTASNSVAGSGAPNAPSSSGGSSGSPSPPSSSHASSSPSPKPSPSHSSSGGGGGHGGHHH